MALLPRLLRKFYETGLAHLPVLANAGEKGADKSADRGTDRGTEKGADRGAERGDPKECPPLAGFLSRRHLDRWMTNIERIDHSYETIPQELLVRDRIPKDILMTADSDQSFPVLNLKGEQVGVWDLTALLHAVSLSPLFSSAPGSLTPPAVEEPFTVESSRKWMGELILEAIPWPLFAADLKGRTLFYNERFVDQILSRPIFKKSIRLIENYLLGLVNDLSDRTLSGHAFQQEGSSGYHPATISVWLKELGLYLRVISLQAKAIPKGHLYVFQEGSDAAFEAEIARRLAAGGQLEAMIDEIESGIIRSVLSRKESNISHSAAALGLKRSTLQNKIKRLKLGSQSTSGVPKRKAGEAASGRVRSRQNASAEKRPASRLGAEAVPRGATKAKKGKVASATPKSKAGQAGAGKAVAGASRVSKEAGGAIKNSKNRKNSRDNKREAIGEKRALQGKQSGKRSGKQSGKRSGKTV